MSPCLQSPFFNSNRNKEQFSIVVTDTRTGKGFASAYVYVLANRFHEGVGCRFTHAEAYL